MVPINYLAVIVSAVAAMVLGSLWYGPLFGKPWMAMMGITKESIAQGKKQDMAKSYGFMALGSLVMAYVFAHTFVFATNYTQTFGVAGGLTNAVWTWLGFIAPVTMGTVLWEGKPWKLWMLNSGYYLASLAVMGVIFGLIA
jgi:hypothetical protein